MHSIIAHAFLFLFFPLIKILLCLLRTDFLLILSHTHTHAFCQSLSLLIDHHWAESVELLLVVVTTGIYGLYECVCMHNSCDALRARTSKVFHIATAMYSIAYNSHISLFIYIMLVICMQYTYYYYYYYHSNILKCRKSIHHLIELWMSHINIHVIVYSMWCLSV